MAQPWLEPHLRIAYQQGIGEPVEQGAVEGLDVVDDEQLAQQAQQLTVGLQDQGFSLSFSVSQSCLTFTHTVHWHRPDHQTTCPHFL